MMFSRLAVAMALAGPFLSAQFAVPVAPDVLLVGSYHTPLPYEAILTRLDNYYQEQVGRKLVVAFPKIEERTHYEVWHDMWVFFAVDGSGTSVTMKAATDAATTLLAKGWMLQIAGRSDGAMPLHFEELAPLRAATAEYYGSKRDIAPVLQSAPAVLPVVTWQHAGLFVSGVPLARVIVNPAGSHGVHKVSASGENAAAAKQLLSRVMSTTSRPCVCAVYSEAAEIEQGIRQDARGKAEDMSATTAQSVYLAQLDPKVLEEQLRAVPETQKRLTGAAGWYAVKYRVDKPYPAVAIRWSELTGYSRDSGKFDSERPLGQSSAPGSKGVPLTGRTKLEQLKPGAYRISLEGQSRSGKVAIDQRDYWFDGHTFEEI
jgi:hypothetical protein